MIPRDRLPRLRYSDLERLGKLAAGIQAVQQSVYRSKVGGAEAISQHLSDLWDLVMELSAPAQRAIANWGAAHPAINPPEEPAGDTGPTL